MKPTIKKGDIWWGHHIWEPPAFFILVPKLEVEPKRWGGGIYISPDGMVRGMSASWYDDKTCKKLLWHGPEEVEIRWKER